MKLRRVNRNLSTEVIIILEILIRQMVPLEILEAPEQCTQGKVKFAVCKTTESAYIHPKMGEDVLDSRTSPTTFRERYEYLF